jgi:hypothetical protein
MLILEIVGLDGTELDSFLLVSYRRQAVPLWRGNRLQHCLICTSPAV